MPEITSLASQLFEFLRVFANQELWGSGGIVHASVEVLIELHLHHDQQWSWV